VACWTRPRWCSTHLVAGRTPLHRSSTAIRSIPADGTYGHSIFRDSAADSVFLVGAATGCYRAERIHLPGICWCGCPRRRPPDLGYWADQGGSRRTRLTTLFILPYMSCAPPPSGQLRFIEAVCAIDPIGLEYRSAELSIKPGAAPVIYQLVHLPSKKLVYTPPPLPR
jgi:hypothetical protein